jgi:hypothetical protein
LHVKVSLNLFVSFFLLKLKKGEQIIFMSDLYDLNLFHFKVWVISWRVYRQKAINFTEHLKTFYEAFCVEFYIKMKPIECKITYVLYI